MSRRKSDVGRYARVPGEFRICRHWRPRVQDKIVAILRFSGVQTRQPDSNRCVSSKLRRQEIQAINAGAGTGLYAINPVPGFHFSSSAASALSSVLATTLPLRFLPSVSSCVYSSENSLILGCESRIEYSGLSSAAFGLHGATSWLSSNQKPWSPGIALAFVCSGASGQSQRPLAGQSSMPRFELSSVGWRRRIPPGALLGFTVNFSNSASTCLNAQFLATSGACLLPSTHANSGLLSCAITAR